ncbi:MAG: hypothetical protein KAH32_03690 [Chlamydiia bacterium]|nr:hypothetical protein [Chlamydiia bacterium]
MSTRGLSRVLDNFLRNISTNVGLNNECELIFEEHIKSLLENYLKSDVSLGGYSIDNESIEILTTNVFQANLLHNNDFFRKEIISIYRKRRIKILNVIFLKKR